MSLFDVTPQLAPLRQYGKETQKTFDAQVKIAPALYQANEIYQPLYNSLNLQNLDQFLTGSKAQQYDTYSWVPGTTSRRRGGGGGGFLEQIAPPGSPESFGFSPMDGDPLGSSLLGGLFGGDEGKRKKVPGRWEKSGVGTREAQRGFLDIYENDIIPTMARAQSSQRAADIADVSRLGPEAREALRVANPDAAKLLDELFSQAQGDLGAGASLTPAQQRLLQQYARAGQSARGVGFGPRDGFEEALTSLDYGRGLQAERRGNATNVLGQLEHFYGDAFQQILGRSSQSGAQAIGGQAGALSKQGGLFNPESGYAQDIYNTDFNAIQSRNNAEASNNAAILSGIISSIGSIGGGAAGAMM